MEILERIFIHTYYYTYIYSTHLRLTYSQSRIFIK